MVVPEGVNVAIAQSLVKVTGPKGELSFDLPEQIEATWRQEDRSILVSPRGGLRRARALHGMSRSLIAGMVTGVSQGFHKRLLIYGTGYGCSVSGRQLHLNCGFMGRGGKNKAQFMLDIPAGLEVEVEVPAARGDTDPAKVVIRGCDKRLVGQFAAECRRTRPPEPYKGKGVRYAGEYVRRKVGKAFGGAVT